jgi:transposase
VSDPRPTREQLIALAKRDPEAIADLVLSLWSRVEALEAKVAELQRNSRTSSKPPSSDKGNFANPPKPNPKSLRTKSGKKSGGQPGHPGSTLQQSATPDQYGPAVRATALYLGGYQMIPYQRLAEMFGELFGCPLSQGTLGNIVCSGGRHAAAAMAPVREALRKAPTAHADETGCRVMGKRHWLHVFSTSFLTCFHLDAKRGAEAMVDLLLEAKELADREKTRTPEARRIIGEGTVERIMAKYSRIVIDGFAINPEPPPPPPGTRGRVKRSKALNLLHRLDTRACEIMGFFALPESGVPYDNNQAERDLRMMKVRKKISGTFRSEEHGRAFCELRGIVSSVRKQGRKMLDSLKELIVSPTQLGESLAAAVET